MQFSVFDRFIEDAVFDAVFDCFIEEPRYRAAKMK